MNILIKKLRDFIGFKELSRLVSEQRKVVMAKKVVREKKPSFPRWFDEIEAAISARNPLLNFD